MALGQSPPTTSGIIVISGSDFFDPQTSDLPIATGSIESSTKRGTGIGVLGTVLDLTSGVKIRSTPVTTSGIVVIDIFIGAGEVFVVPVVGNVRLFPIFQGVFPEQDRRIFPVLPQFSTLTPGD